MPTLYDNFSQVRQYIDENAGHVDLSAYVTKTELAGMSYVTSNTLNSYLTVPSSIVPNPTVPYTMYRYGLSSNNQYHFIYPNAISYTNAISTDVNAWASVGTVRNYVEGRITEIESSYATTSQIPIVDEDIIPKSDGSYQIGSASYMYGALYANKVYLGDGTSDAAHLFPTYAYVADYVATYGGGVIDENIIPKENSTYTLGNNDYQYSATYTYFVGAYNSGICVDSANGFVFNINGNNRFTIANSTMRPIQDNFFKFGSNSERWKSTYVVDTYTSNVYATNAYISNYNNLIWTGTAAEYALLDNYTTYQFYLVTAE